VIAGNTKLEAEASVVILRKSLLFLNIARAIGFTLFFHPQVTIIF
jgi:hypothetical protein